MYDIISLLNIFRSHIWEALKNNFQRSNLLAIKCHCILIHAESQVITTIVKIQNIPSPPNTHEPEAQGCWVTGSRSLCVLDTKPDHSDSVGPVLNVRSWKAGQHGGEKLCSQTQLMVNSLIFSKWVNFSVPHLPQLVKEVWYHKDC